ncbi:hypothetical protein ATSB10_07040 [Dyella thiooxydans]|uniref:Uncharacterized protein n=1 Tax=Dyella thiooxydans TaxID=445710 RepID=A0A160MZ69_9GAMM|nr:hypothetical protein ATSB10_07040 [Dyella thiooxydans]
MSRCRPLFESDNRDSIFPSHDFICYGYEVAKFVVINVKEKSSVFA